MKTLLSVLRCPPGTDQKYRALHRLWLAAALTGLGCAAGLVTLALSATAYTGLDSTSLFTHYLTSPRLLALNLLPPVLVMWLVGILLYREKVTRRGLLMLATGLLGLILLNMG